MFILHCLKDDYRERPLAVIVCCFVESDVKLSDTENRLKSAVKVCVVCTSRVGGVTSS